MFTKLEMRNFKRFADATVELGQAVVLIGPNNMGKTTALQALALWDAGVRAWVTEYGTSGKTPKKRPGVTINRKDLKSLLTEVAESQGSQIIAASHSEVVLNEAANRGRVVAFVGRPHTINDKETPLVETMWRKREIENYFCAEDVLLA